MSESRKTTDSTLPQETKLHNFSFLNDQDSFSVSLKRDFFTDAPEAIPARIYYKILQEEKLRFIAYIEKNTIAQFFDDNEVFRHDKFGAQMQEAMNKIYKLSPVSTFEKILNLMIEKPISEEYLDTMMDLLFQTDTVKNPWLMGLSQETTKFFTEFMMLSIASSYFDITVNQSDQYNMLSEMKNNSEDHIFLANLLLTAYKNLKVNLSQHIISVLCKCDAPNLLSIFLDKNIAHLAGIFPLLINEATNAGNEKIVDMLLERGADINHPIQFRYEDSDQHEPLTIVYTPLATAIQGLSSDCQTGEKIIQKLMDKNPDTDRVCFLQYGENPKKVLNLQSFCEQMLDNKNINTEKRIEIQAVVDKLLDRPNFKNSK